ncbi:hypothetical protein TNIN_253541 [Trichonephila inaurata madagascariensis]|uniref:Uncharacterized protein n=1 Tax=Trichonephila inaurata madagascariensis TaxID=2747483 RepID=A0A8X6XM38_9ARAC|nr:hypothetical protein TNIN_253541 [Trichonephila inaurata madagascariensis]
MLIIKEDLINEQEAAVDSPSSGGCLHPIGVGIKHRRRNRKLRFVNGDRNPRRNSFLSRQEPLFANWNGNIGGNSLELENSLSSKSGFMEYLLLREDKTRDLNDLSGFTFAVHI